MKKNLFATAIAASGLLFAVPAFAQTGLQKKDVPPPTDPAVKMSMKDKDFVNKAAIVSLAEIEMGTLAQANGLGQEVKDFGARLVADHEKANRELASLVAPAGVALPAKVDDEHQKHLEMLKAKKGAEFDAMFAKHMVDGHLKAIALFTTQSRSGEMAGLKEFANKTLPTLKEHLAIAQGLAKAKKPAAM